MMDCFGHRASRRLFASDGRQMTIYSAQDAVLYVYSGHDGPFTPERLLGVLVPTLDGDYAVCGSFGRSAGGRETFEALWAQGQLRRLHEMGVTQ